MNTIAKISVAAAASLIAVGYAQAGEQAMKPLQGWSFHSGTKHAVAYFQSGSSNCQLVVSSADEASSTAARYETAVEIGNSASYRMSEGNLIVFTCYGQTMIASAVEISAAN